MAETGSPKLATDAQEVVTQCKHGVIASNPSINAASSSISKLQGDLMTDGTNLVNSTTTAWRRTGEGWYGRQVLHSKVLGLW